MEDALVVANPIRGLWRTLDKGKGGKVNKGTVKVKALNAEQARRFLAAAEEHAHEHHPYFCALMWAGLRPGEGFALTPEKIDVRGRSILVDAQISQRGGVKTTKTGEERKVDVSTRLAAVLAEPRAQVPSARVVSIAGEPQGAARPLGPWLFYPDLGPSPNEKDAQRVYKRALNGMRRALRLAGLPTHHSLHSLRHTYGSQLIAAGVSPAYVQQQMGHASIQQTVDTYGSWLPVRVPGAVDALADATAPAVGSPLSSRMIATGRSEGSDRVPGPSPSCPQAIEEMGLRAVGASPRPLRLPRSPCAPGGTDQPPVDGVTLHQATGKEEDRDA